MTAARNERVQPARLWPLDRLEALFALHHAHPSISYMAYADEIIYGIRGRDHIWHTRTSESQVHTIVVLLCTEDGSSCVTIRRMRTSSYAMEVPSAGTCRPSRT